MYGIYIVIIIFSIQFVSKIHSTNYGNVDNDFDEIQVFDTNDVENLICVGDCETTRFDKRSNLIETRTRKFKLRKRCDDIFRKCLEFRFCENECVVSDFVIPYAEYQEIVDQNPVINPCTKFAEKCLYDADDKNIWETDNPFVFI